MGISPRRSYWSTSPEDRCREQILCKFHRCSTAGSPAAHSMLTGGATDNWGAPCDRAPRRMAVDRHSERTRDSMTIEARGLTKRYGATTAVDHISFVVHPGQVIGVLGPNGAVKSTTMRLLLGLDAPPDGEVTVDGRPYGAHRYPLDEVGALLDAMALHPARRGKDHLRALARSNGLGPKRVTEVLDAVGLADVGHRRAGTYSLGMKQRLGIAAALLGDPAILLFD